MGQAKRKRSAMAAFVEQHPRCCFCGGERPATTGDHVPGRAIFLERKWPEGYLFPACAGCNAATRREEMLIAVLARAFPNAETEIEQTEFQAALSGLANNWREMILKLQPSLGQRLGSPMDVWNLGDPDVRAAMDKWAGKLGCALHYHHTGRILPPAGGVIIRWQTNRSVFDEGLPAGLSRILSGAPALKRSSYSLKDQFAYLYGLIEGHRGSVISCRLRYALFAHLFVADDVGAFPEDLRQDAWRPFAWPPDPDDIGSVAAPAT